MFSSKGRTSTESAVCLYERKESSVTSHGHVVLSCLSHNLLDHSTISKQNHLLIIYQYSMCAHTPLKYVYPHTLKVCVSAHPHSMCVHAPSQYVCPHTITV